MNINTILKYASAAALLGSIFYLTLVGKVDVANYMNLATALLGGLAGYHAANTGAKQ